LFVPVSGVTEILHNTITVVIALGQHKLRFDVADAGKPSKTGNIKTPWGG
jgi:hypothetical protein